MSNWVMTDVLRVAGERTEGMAAFPVAPERLAAMLALIESEVISGKIAKEVFEEMLVSPEAPEEIVRRKGLVQVSDAGAIERAVRQVLERNAPQVEQYRAGNRKVFGYFVGETMKLMKGKANPAIVNTVLRTELERRG